MITSKGLNKLIVRFSREIEDIKEERIMQYETIKNGKTDDDVLDIRDNMSRETEK
jgi:hypothetical protein